ncbi:MAG: DUF58 domain-containing protein [Ectothiorhodospiraceae bacterium]|nr:DUF58 domain-containing protein [Ectothiorhodospiraceae bacterium]
MSVMPTTLRRVAGPWLDRRLGTPRKQVRLAYRRIFVLPTKAGLAFSALLFGIWLGAVNYTNSMAFLLCFLLLGLGLLAMLHTFRNIAGLSVKAEPARPVFAGEAAHFTLRLENPDLRERPALVLRYEREPTVLVDVPAGTDASAVVSVPTKRRGVMKLGQVLIQTTFPTGLVVAWSWLRLDRSCLVYPAPESGSVPDPEGGSGDAGSRPAEGDDDFHSLRRYQPGDSLRQVAWRTLARGQELQTKRFAGNAASSVWLDYDALPQLAMEQRLSRLCRWILDAEAERRPYGLRLPGKRIPPALGADHQERCLRALALFQP